MTSGFGLRAKPAGGSRIPSDWCSGAGAPCPAGWRRGEVQGSAHPLQPLPPLQGRLGAAFVPPLPARLFAAFTLASPATRGSCRRRHTLHCWAAGAAAAACTRASGWSALQSCPARGCQAPAEAPLRPAGAGRPIPERRHRGGGRQPPPGPSLAPSSSSSPPSPQPHHVGVRILHPSRPDFSFPLSLEGGCHTEAPPPPGLPAC